MNLTLTDLDSVITTPNGNYLKVELEGVSESQVVEEVGKTYLLSEMTVEDVANHFGDELVEYIKEENNLEEAE